MTKKLWKKIKKGVGKAEKKIAKAKKGWVAGKRTSQVISKDMKKIVKGLPA